MAYIDHETGTEFAERISGVCKECNSGTMNNALYPAFHFDDADFPFCANCGSYHIDILTF